MKILIILALCLSACSNITEDANGVFSSCVGPCSHHGKANEHVESAIVTYVDNEHRFNVQCICATSNGGQ